MLFYRNPRGLAIDQFSSRDLLYWLSQPDEAWNEALRGYEPREHSIEACREQMRLVLLSRKLDL